MHCCKRVVQLRRKKKKNSLPDLKKTTTIRQSLTITEAMSVVTCKKCSWCFFFFCNFKITLLRIYFHTCSLITTHRSEGPSTTYNPAGAIQPNTGSWRHNPSQVSGQWGSGADGFLAKKWSQFARKGPSLFLTRPWEPSDPEYQGEWMWLYNY